MNRPQSTLEVEQEIDEVYAQLEEGNDVLRDMLIAEAQAESDWLRLHARAYVVLTNDGSKKRTIVDMETTILDMHAQEWETWNLAKAALVGQKSYLRMLQSRIDILRTKAANLREVSR